MFCEAVHEVFRLFPELGGSTVIKVLLHVVRSPFLFARFRFGDDVPVFRCQVNG